MQIGIVGMDEVSNFVRPRLSSMLIMILFGSDRSACCDEAIEVKNPQGETLGIATISPHGERHDGTPSIDGVYVVHHARGGALGVSVGQMLLEAALHRCIERGFATIEIEAYSPGMRRCIERLPEELRARVIVSGHVIDHLDSLDPPP